MKNLLEKAGVIIFALGLMAADSASLLIPLSLLVLGTCVYKLSAKL